MPNKNKTACKRRIRSQRSQRQRYRTARNGGWSPFREASETRRHSNVPAKWWQSPRRWNDERKKRNLVNEIAIQRAATKAALKTYDDTQAQLSAQNATFKESTKLNNQIRTITEALNDRTRPLTTKQRNFFIERRDQLRTASNTANTAVYNAVPADAATAAAAAYPYA